MADLSKLKYLECVIKEVLRIYPAVPFIFREFTEDVIIGLFDTLHLIEFFFIFIFIFFQDNYEIPKRSTAMIFIYQIHRDERYFPEPEKFVPERFLPDNSDKRHPYAYIPFSAGKRNCIGSYKIF